MTCWEERKSAKKTEQGSMGLYESYGSIGGVARYFLQTKQAFGCRLGIFFALTNSSCSYLRRPHLRTECWRREATRITLNAILASKIFPPIFMQSFSGNGFPASCAASVLVSASLLCQKAAEVARLHFFHAGESALSINIGKSRRNTAPKIVFHHGQWILLYIFL